MLIVDGCDVSVVFGEYALVDEESDGLFDVVVDFGSFLESEHVCCLSFEVVERYGYLLFDGVLCGVLYFDERYVVDVAL